jgi:hypothetical protein
MDFNPPVDFQEKAQGPKGTTNADYPYALKATDLMKDFVFATLILEDGLAEETTGKNGHTQRKLKIPSPPTSGTHVLSVQDGTFAWLETEEC